MSNFNKNKFFRILIAGIIANTIIIAFSAKAEENPVQSENEQKGKASKEKEKFSIHGKFQTRWELTGDNYTKTWFDSIYIPRARIDTKWKPFDWSKLFLEVELADGVKLRDAYGEFSVFPFFNITAGNFKKPFSRLRLTSPWDLVIPERGLLDKYAVDNTTYGGFGARDLGLMFSGEIFGPVIHTDPMKFQYFFGAFNNKPGDDKAYRDFSGRVQLRLIKGLILAANSTVKYYQVSTALKSASLFGGDIKWEIGDFKAQLEGAYGDNVDKNDKLWGTHLTTSYEVNLNDSLTLIPAVMAEVFDPEAKLSDDTDFRIAGALNLDIQKKVRIILSIDKTWEDIYKQTNTSGSPFKFILQGNLSY